MAHRICIIIYYLHIYLQTYTNEHTHIYTGINLYYSDYLLYMFTQFLHILVDIRRFPNSPRAKRSVSRYASYFSYTPTFIVLLPFGL